MSLIITFMLEPAKLQMNCASASGAMNARGDPTQLARASPYLELQRSRRFASRFERSAQVAAGQV
jgi:hypothetical protein